MKNIIYFDTLESTNKYAKENISVLNDRDVIFTTNQTNGKGRETRIWNSSNDSLTFSLVLKDNYSLTHFKDISLMMGASVYLTLVKYLKNVSIKWPNDIYVNDAKICGILLEGVSFNELEGIIVGVGININNDNSLTKLVTNKKVTSMYLETNTKYDIKVILNEVLDNFYKLLSEKNTYLDIVRNNNYLKGKFGYHEGIKVEIIDISNNNSLIVNKDGKLIELDTGEIEL